MNIGQDELFAGEIVLVSKAANAIIRPSEYGLSRFPFDQWMGAVGMKGMEAIGGKLHVTNYRLVFKSHAINRLTGTFSILLPTIVDVEDASWFIVRKLAVVTRSQRCELVVWGVPKLISLIRSARAELTPAEEAALMQAVIRESEKLGAGLERFAPVDVSIHAIQVLSDLAKAAEVVRNPLQLSTIVNLMELLAKD